MASKLLQSISNTGGYYKSKVNDVSVSQLGCQEKTSSMLRTGGGTPACARCPWRRWTWLEVSDIVDTANSSATNCACLLGLWELMMNSRVDGDKTPRDTPQKRNEREQDRLDKT